MKDPGAPKIHELIHRLAMCKQQDIVVDASTMALRREEVVWTWGRVKSHYGLPSILGQTGYTIMGATGINTTPTHAITIRAGIGLIITSTAFIDEEFRKSPPRWYRVLGWTETDDFYTFPVRMVELSDFALPPQGALTARPTPVEL